MVLTDSIRPPAAAGYRMPAEWDRHDATWLAWPLRRSDWPGKFAPIQWVYGEIVRTLARFETVNLLVRDTDHHTAALKVLTASRLPSGENFGSPPGPSMRTACSPFASATKRPLSRANAILPPPGERTIDQAGGSSLSTSARPVPSGRIE